MTVADMPAGLALWTGMPGITLFPATDAPDGLKRYLARNPGLSVVCAPERQAGRGGPGRARRPPRATCTTWPSSQDTGGGASVGRWSSGACGPEGRGNRPLSHFRGRRQRRGQGVLAARRLGGAAGRARHVVDDLTRSGRRPKTLPLTPSPEGGRVPDLLPSRFRGGGRGEGLSLLRIPQVLLQERKRPLAVDLVAAGEELDRRSGRESSGGSRRGSAPWRTRRRPSRRCRRRRRGRARP